MAQYYGNDRPPAPQPLSPGEERTWATIAHGVPAVALPLSAGTLGFVSALVIFLMYKDRGPFVRAHAANSLNVQIMTLIYLAISAVLILALVGFLLYPAVIVVAVVFHVVGALRAHDGQWWTPPFTPRFVR
jgi:uncharacterized Tic20 family protein